MLKCGIQNLWLKDKVGSGGNDKSLSILPANAQISISDLKTAIQNHTVPDNIAYQDEIPDE
jgi:hypothetical protein